MPVAVNEEDRVFYQEVDLVLNESVAVIVRKTPPDGHPFDGSELAKDHEDEMSGGTAAFRLIDQVAEAFLHLADAINEEIDELEDGLEEMKNDEIRSRLSELRHDLLHIRRTLGPTRDAIRSVVDTAWSSRAAPFFPARSSCISGIRTTSCSGR